MNNYQPFLISNFRTGFNESVEPWLLPRDSFQVMNNAHLYRGVVDKIGGYSLYSRMSYRSVVQMTGVVDSANQTFTTILGTIPSTDTETIKATVNVATGQIEILSNNGNGEYVSSISGLVVGTINYIANSPVPAQPAGYITVTFSLPPVNMTPAAIQYNAVILEYDAFVGSVQPIMGIKPYIGANNTQEILIFDTRRTGKIVDLGAAISTITEMNYGIQEIPHEVQLNLSNAQTGFNGTIGPFIRTLPGAPYERNLVTFKVFNNLGVLQGTITDNGAGVLTGALLDPAATNYINYFTGEWRMTFLALVPANYTMNFYGAVFGNYWTGTKSNFFSTANYQSYTFITNALDDPRYYDGTSIKYLDTRVDTSTTQVAPFYISKVLHFVVYNNRLIMLSMYVDNVPQLSMTRWSKIFEPLNWTEQEFLSAPTSDPICLFFLIGANLVVRFSASERCLTYTADAFSPFRWDPTNLMWRCDSNYGGINYDKWGSSVGLAAIVGSDGVNVTRVDEIIPDITNNARIDEQQPFPAIDQESIGQCYGQRFDTYKEGWLCYKKYSDEDGVDGVQASDTVLAFNYLDSTYAVYEFPFSVLGTGKSVNSNVWENTFTAWKNAKFTWSSFSQTKNSLTELGGDQFGKVYQIGVGNSITSPVDGSEIPCLMNVVTKDFNPYLEQGEQARFGYIDFLMSSNDDTAVRIQFYLNNQIDPDYDTYYQETKIQLIGIADSKVWKRIYVGSIGKVHTIRIYQNADDFAGDISNQPVRIHAMCPYFKPAGRVFT